MPRGGNKLAGGAVIGDEVSICKTETSGRKAVAAFVAQNRLNYG
jgi:hypothetical protein